MRRWAWWMVATMCLAATTACGDDADDTDEPAAGSGGRGGAGAGGKEAGTGGRANAGSGAGRGGAGADGGIASGFALTSSVVAEGEKLPGKYRCAGSPGGPTGPNPPFEWTGAPDGTKSFALIMRDRTFRDFQHWTLYDIPADTKSLSEGVPTGAEPAMPAGAKQAANSAPLTGPGYYGPCGASGMNNYEFKLYALDVETLPMPGTTGASVEAMLEMHDLATTSLKIVSGP